MTLLAVSKPPPIDTLIKWHLKDMAKFADTVCRKMVIDREPFNELVLLQDAEIDFSEFNAKSLGNLAFIAFYSGQIHYKNAAVKMINRYKKYLENEKGKEKV